MDMSKTCENDLESLEQFLSSAPECTFDSDLFDMIQGSINLDKPNVNEDDAKIEELTQETNRADTTGTLKIFKSKSILEAILRKEINSPGEIVGFKPNVNGNENESIVSATEISSPNTLSDSINSPNDPITTQDEAVHLKKALEALQWGIMEMDRIYKCAICGYQTPHRYKIANQHMILHTGIKPFKCSLCNYKAAFKCNLKNHMKTHSEESSYKCDLCYYHTKRKHYLDKHIRDHMKTKFFQCHLCSKKFGYEGNLENHINKRHVE